MRRSKPSSFHAAIAALSLTALAGCQAQPGAEAEPAAPVAAVAAAATPGAGASTTGATVLRGPQLQRSDTSLSPALRDLPAVQGFGPPVERRRPLPVPRPLAAPVVPWVAPLAPQPRAAAPAPLLDFLGVGQGFTGPGGAFTVNAAPPDSAGAVGPRHYVQMVNAGVAIFDKAGVVLAGPLLTNAIWAGFGGGCEANNDGDGMVLYDRMADRWVISQFSVTTQPMLECVAVSQTADPTGAYHRYAFSYGASMPDYPKLAVWPDAYYATYNMFNAAGTAYLGAQVCALDRAAMLAGQPATQQCFTTSTTYGGLLPSHLDGRRPPPAGAPNTHVALGATATTLAVWQFHVDWATPANTTFTGPATVNVLAHADPCPMGNCVPQLGTSNKIDALGDRLLTRLAYRNHGSFEALVVNHTVAVGGSAGVRWYELRNPAAPVLQQSGTIATTGAWRWMASVAEDQVGDLALGYSHSDPTAGTGSYPSIRYAGRAWNDAAGLIGLTEAVLHAGGGAQTGTLGRWGDYTSMTVDPVDDCTFWYTNQYQPASGSFNWATRIGSFKLPACPPKLALSGPAAAVAGSPITVNLTAQDQLGNTLTPYVGSPGLTSSDAAATIPATAVFENGAATASVTFRTAGTAVLTATDPLYPESLTGQLSVQVGPAPAVAYVIGGLPGSATAGNTLAGTVSALDAYGNVDSAHAATATVAVSDARATFPATVTFVAGQASLPITLRAVGLQHVTVTGPAGTTLSAAGTVEVKVGPTRDYAIVIPGGATVGAPVDFTVAARDQAGNATPGYAGTGRANSSDAAASLPASLSFVAGQASGRVTFATAGNQSLTISDGADGTITGTATVAVAATRSSSGCGCGTASGTDLAGLLSLVALAWRRRSRAGQSGNASRSPTTDVGSR